MLLQKHEKSINGHNIDKSITICAWIVYMDGNHLIKCQTGVIIYAYMYLDQTLFTWLVHNVCVLDIGCKHIFIVNRNIYFVVKTYRRFRCLCPCINYWCLETWLLLYCIEIYSRCFKESCKRIVQCQINTTPNNRGNSHFLLLKLDCCLRYLTVCKTHLYAMSSLLGAFMQIIAKWGKYFHYIYHFNSTYIPCNPPFL